MKVLAEGLSLSVFLEPDPEGGEQVRIKLANELEMLNVEVCQQINVTTSQSRRYHVRESLVIAMRQLVSKSVKEGLINDSPGAWKIANIEIEME